MEKEGRSISEFNEKLIKVIRFKLKNQNHKKQPKTRKDTDIVNIDGKRQRWADFKKKFLEDAKRKNVEAQRFTLNKGDPDREKYMVWNKKMGFFSEDSDDE